MLAPWERAFDRFATPLEYFIRQETSSGLLLVACTVLALGLANSELAGLYHHVLETPLSIGLGSWQISRSLHHWVNEGLMTLFFFVVGLEIKREMLVGELAGPRHALLPIIAAVAGMVAPALLYVVFVLRNQGLRSELQTMENAVVGVMSPLQRLEHKLHTPVALLVVPLFALAIPLDLDQLAEMARHPVTQGVMVGLLVGKTAGITAATWLALKCGLAQLPKDMRLRHVVGIALLGGIGFTMSMFITELAFGDSPELVVAAKSGILCASLTAGVLGLLWLRLTVPLSARGSG